MVIHITKVSEKGNFSSFFSMCTIWMADLNPRKCYNGRLEQNNNRRWEQTRTFFRGLLWLHFLMEWRVLTTCSCLPLQKGELDLILVKHQLQELNNITQDGTALTRTICPILRLKIYHPLLVCQAALLAQTASDICNWMRFEVLLENKSAREQHKHYMLRNVLFWIVTAASLRICAPKYQ